MRNSEEIRIAKGILNRNVTLLHRPINKNLKERLAKRYVKSLNNGY